MSPTLHGFSQVLFHVATMMPTVDERCNNKKMHIGNDFVLIVYNESGQEFNITSIRAQFCYAGVVVEPLDHGTNRIVVNTKGKLQVSVLAVGAECGAVGSWRRKREVFSVVVFRGDCTLVDRHKTGILPTWCIALQGTYIIGNRL